MRLRTAEVVSDGRPVGVRDVTIVGSHIFAVEAPGGAQHVGVDAEVDATGLLLAPGLIDVHRHGGVGHDVTDGTTEAMATLGRHLAAGGVTSWVPTTVSASRTTIDRVLAVHAEHRRASNEARSLGVHLEGPYVAAARCGAQDPAHLRDADADEWRAWLGTGQVALVTLAPERDPDGVFLRAAIDAGVRIAVGHTDATYDEVLAAVEAGVSQATHLFNGMPPLHHRAPGPVAACLVDDRVTVQVIADLVHLHPAILRLTLACVGVERLLLITDAMRAAGRPDGCYDLGDQLVRVRDGVARTADGALAGSTLELLQAVRNLHEATGCSVPEALHTASGVPARAMGCDDRGAVRTGLLADLVLLEPRRLRPVLTLIDGVVAFDDLPEERWIRRRNP
jgi:N-acetylglucosamine-6-phosphate deacetylase